jgi:hypothetical protein
MNFESDINPRDMTRHPGGVYSAPPARGCMCPICIHSRMVGVWCPMCQNVGLIPRCWTCFRVPDATTDDPSLAA